MLKILSILILCSQMDAWGYQVSDKEACNNNDELYESIQNSTAISPELKSGLEQVRFWHDLHLKYPKDDEQITELREQGLNLAQSIDSQLNKFYEGEERDTRLQKFNEIYIRWMRNAPTLRHWYKLCIETAWACSPESSGNRVDDMLESANLLTTDGFIIGIIYPSTENIEFNGTVGVAARVAGIATNVWVAGLSANPDLKADGKKQTPQDFLWNAIHGHGCQYRVTHSILKKSDYQKILEINLIENPTNEVYFWHYDWLYENKIKEHFPMRLNEEAYGELLKKNFVSQ
ncbi:MAG: hypothetical protein K0M45_02545 [Candidatus Paracaedibacteraceae bacterium]|nr:hypothetical protein [Candidatus Paracaedibacteraceae bacterium]